jgi:hypothetical protein
MNHSHQHLEIRQARQRFAGLDGSYSPATAAPWGPASASANRAPAARSRPSRWTCTPVNTGIGRARKIRKVILAKLMDGAGRPPAQA